jgi:serine/threonine-protein kinase
VSVAVAPFQVLSPEPVPELELWREGIVDVMARNLDGAGTVRTISPAVVLRRATRPIGQRDAAELAKRVGARYAVVGTFTPTSGDSVRVRAWLVEAAADSVIAERTWVLRDVRLAPDSLTLAVLETLGERHRLGATDARMHLAGVSPLALREFLRGEQHYRRTAWDSALAAYTRATAQDSTFALPARRIALVREWQFGGVDSMAIANALRAGRFARGLPPRDSLLVVADSIAAALNVRTDWALARRLFATVDAAASRHPDDPEVWYAVGEARLHHGYGRLTGVTEQGALDAFDRSIALDSSFAPAYVHAVELALRLDGAAAAARRSRPYLALGPSDEHAAAIRLVDRLIDPARAGDATTARMLDSLPLEVVRRAWYQMARWRDTAEVGVRLLSVMDRRQRRDTRRLRSFLSLQYAYRGRFAEAYDAMAGRPSRLYAEMALIGALPPTHADSVLERWIPIDSAGHTAAVRTALAWWATAGDVQALERVRVELARRRAAAPTDDARRAALASLRALEGYEALARRDTSAALRAFDALPDTLCLGCYVDRLTHGRLLAASGRLTEADVVLRERLWTFVTPIEILFLLERARVHARLGRQAEAARGFDMVIEAWQRGDQGSAQRYVAAARAERAALGAGSVAAAPSSGPRGTR